jgi:hypothetical protein
LETPCPLFFRSDLYLFVNQSNICYMSDYANGAVGPSLAYRHRVTHDVHQWDLPA